MLVSAHIPITALRSSALITLSTCSSQWLSAPMQSPFHCASHHWRKKKGWARKGEHAGAVDGCRFGPGTFAIAEVVRRGPGTFAI